MSQFAANHFAASLSASIFCRSACMHESVRMLSSICHSCVCKFVLAWTVLQSCCIFTIRNMAVYMIVRILTVRKAIRQRTVRQDIHIWKVRQMCSPLDCPPYLFAIWIIRHVLSATCPRRCMVGHLAMGTTFCFKQLS
ncbi:hypothetical protein GOBAR_AA13313 [Gossypium barbadense]|uniref:Uncharacterized protein n=1 Tax=Gossypium barbadense TaxID=3634 RepID=A0A2P5XVE1_GOSBA|nr:hypothetical protein GOBAR_AA13313 [Gossypium barbadense]